jgi:hypothetical protein
MTGNVLIFSSDKHNESSLRLAKLASFLGMKHSILLPDEATNITTTPSCAIANVNNCELVIKALPPDLPLLVYGFHDCPKHREQIEKLSKNKITQISNITEKGTYHIPHDDPDILSPFAGLQFGPANQLSDAVFTLPDSDNSICQLAFCNGKPFFIKFRNRKLYLLGVAGVTNIENPTDRMPTTASLFSSLTCFMLFIQQAADQQDTSPQYGCVVIDDPLLKPKYGFINYKKLIQDCTRHNYAVTIAHIPTNINKTDSATAGLIAASNSRISICMHGLEHARAEFSSTDAGLLRSKLSQAVSLMNKHSQLHGLDWDHIMVFPHGLFSTTALNVLAEYNINTALVSVDALAPGNNPTELAYQKQYTIADFIKPAMTAYGGAHLFLRRYPNKLEDFVFDTILKRPIIIATHNDNFSDNAKHLHSFIDALNRMIPNIQWLPLAKIIDNCIVESVKHHGQAADTHPYRTRGRFILKRKLMSIRDNLATVKK